MEAYVSHVDTELGPGRLFREGQSRGSKPSVRGIHLLIEGRQDNVIQRVTSPNTPFPSTPLGSCGVSPTCSGVPTPCENREANRWFHNKMDHLARS